MTSRSSISAMRASDSASDMHPLFPVLANNLDMQSLLHEFTQFLSARTSICASEYRIQGVANAPPERLLSGEQSQTDNIVATSVSLFTMEQAANQLKVFSSDKLSGVELLVLDSATDQLRAPLHNATMFYRAMQQAHFDHLTGVFNRIGMLPTLEREISLSRRHRNSLSVVILDIDNFKTMNDSHGHAAGDAVLQAVADVLLSASREEDAVFRFGGEEFFLILPHSNASGACVLTDQIRQLIESHTVHYMQSELKVTVSAGVAELQDGDSLEDFFDRADKAMYRAKREGRNQVAMAR